MFLGGFLTLQTCMMARLRPGRAILRIWCLSWGVGVVQGPKAPTTGVALGVWGPQEEREKHLQWLRPKRG